MLSLSLPNLDKCRRWVMKRWKHADSSGAVTRSFGSVERGGMCLKAGGGCALQALQQEQGGFWFKKKKMEQSSVTKTQLECPCGNTYLCL